MRMHAQTAMIENGFVRIPENASWLAEYLHEMNVFPKGKHDDQVDSTAQFLDWFKKPMPNWGIFECTRQRAQEIAQRPEDRERHRVLLEGRVGQSVQTFSGRHLEVAWDGTLELSADDGADLAGAFLYDAQFLNCAQLVVTRNWQSAFRDDVVACGASIPDRQRSE